MTEGSSTPALVDSACRSLASLLEAVDNLEAAPFDRTHAALIEERGHLRPEEEAALKVWFARFLTVRAELWEVLADVSAPVDGNVARIKDRTELSLFVVGYSAACLIVRLDRLLVEEFATGTSIQRKLNEGSKRFRIPRKQFTAVHESLSDPSHALAIYKAMRFAKDEAPAIAGLANDVPPTSLLSKLILELPRLESSLDPSKRSYARLLLAYLKHALRRRGASARQKTSLAAIESVGRVAAEMRDRSQAKRVRPEVRASLEALLLPGDVIVTRHDRAFTNLFLPGYWPHSALYVGSDQDRRRLGIRLDDGRTERWTGDRKTLEALKDGVLFRSLDETLGVDAVAVIRPVLGQAEIVEGLSRAATHEGKLYNFDFDFFRSDRLVCTEVVYRAFDGLGAIKFDLQERAGRPTLSAEDLLDLALDSEMFEPVAVFGAESCATELIVGAAARAALARSYRPMESGEEAASLPG